MQFLLYFLLAATLPADVVTIEKAEPMVEYKRFDRSKLPDPAPPLESGEDAVCEYFYQAQAHATYQSSVPPKSGKGTVTVKTVTMKLGLRVTIWLPNDASDRLKEHEETHRKIAEAFFEQAEKFARPLATKQVGRQITVPAALVEKSADAAMETLSKKLCDDYLDAINGPVGKVQKEFDRLTDHGRKVRPSAQEAMKEAMKAAGK